MRNYFTFGSIDSRDYGVYISGSGHFSVPSRAYEFDGIPGRTGDIVLGGRRIENFELTYPCFIAPVNGVCGNYADYMSAFFALRNALLSVNGYADLKDSYSSGTYYRGVYVGGITAESMPDLKSGEFEITFNCDPRRFYTTTTTINFTAGQYFAIQTNKKRGIPVITATGTGDVVFTPQRQSAHQEWVYIRQNFADGIVINSELQDCYSNDSQKLTGNGYVSFSRYRYPTFNPIGDGESTDYDFSSHGVAGSIEIRWYDL